MSDHGYCYRCNEIITFCECDESIYSKDELIKWQADEIEQLRQGVISLRCQYDELADKNAKLQAEIEVLNAIVDAAGVMCIRRIGEQR